MRVALLSDIHGNVHALDAVLADARSMGVEQYWVLGDFSAVGPEPAAVLDRIVSLPGLLPIRGNTDRYVVTGEGPPPDLAAVRRDPDLIPMYAGIAASIAWTRGFITAGGWFEWLADLPLDIRLDAPDGTRILAVHASPGNDDGEGVHPGHGDDRLSALVTAADADLVFVGHTHVPMVRRLGDALLVNLGSVSNPRSSDLRASYVILELDASSAALQHRRVAYDHDAFTEAVLRSHHPAAGFILSYQRGEESEPAPHADHRPIVTGEWVRTTTTQPADGR